MVFSQQRCVHVTAASQVCIPLTDRPCDRYIKNFPKQIDVGLAAFAHSSASSVVLPLDVVPEDELGDASWSNPSSLISHSTSAISPAILSWQRGHLWYPS